MKQLILILIFLIGGMQHTCVAQQTIMDTIFHDGQQRTFILYVPASYTGTDSAPLVFSFHGFGGNAVDQMEDYDFRAFADTAGFLVAYPQGLATGPGIATWNIGSDTSGTDDIGFTVAMIDSISEMFLINRKRVYASGMSMGGFFSIHLAGRLSEKIAAIASVSGTMTQGTLNASSPAHPTPFLQIHGTSDPLVPYAGNPPLYLSVEEVLDYWIGYNQCDTTPTITQLVDIDTTDGSTVEHILYANGDQGVTVEHMKITGGGHTWPGGTGGRPGTNFDIHASEEIWRFFSRYDINGLIGNTVGVEDRFEAGGNHSLAYPNPFHSHTTIGFSLDRPGQVSLKIYDMTGRLVETLVNEPKTPGGHALIWDGTDTQGNAMPSATYFYLLETESYAESASISLLR